MSQKYNKRRKKQAPVNTLKSAVAEIFNYQMFKKKYQM
jgi:hypothetical protein